MKKLLSLLLMGCISTSGFTTESQIGKVFYIAFNVKLYIPYNEYHFENQADCFSFIEQQNFEQMLKLTNEVYKKNIIYGKIKFKDKTYFVDREGVVSDSQNIYKLKDKGVYEKVLKENQLYCKR